MLAFLLVLASCCSQQSYSYVLPSSCNPHRLSPSLPNPCRPSTRSVPPSYKCTTTALLRCSHLRAHSQQWTQWQHSTARGHVQCLKHPFPPWASLPTPSGTPRRQSGSATSFLLTSSLDYTRRLSRRLPPRFLRRGVRANLAPGVPTS